MDWNSITDTLSTVKKFGQAAGAGVWEGGKSMVEGFGQLGKAGYKTATDSAYRDQVFDKATDLAKSSANFAAQAWKDPMGTAKSSWDGAQNAVNAVSDRYVAARDAAKAAGTLPEFYGNVIGRGGFEVGTVLIPVAKLGKLGKVGEVVADTEKVANVEKTTASAVKVASELPELKLSSKITCAGQVEKKFNFKNYKMAEGAKLGDFGENVVKDKLKSEGYDTFYRVQNRSGNGVDIVAKNSKTGEMIIAEVKSTQQERLFGKELPLSKDQAKGGKEFSRSRLERASKKEDGYTDGISSKEAKKALKDMYKAMDEQGAGITYKKYDVYVDGDGTLYSNIKESNW